MDYLIFIYIYLMYNFVVVLIIFSFIKNFILEVSNCGWILNINKLRIKI